MRVRVRFKSDADEVQINGIIYRPGGLTEFKVNKEIFTGIERTVPLRNIH